MMNNFYGQSIVKKILSHTINKDMPSHGYIFAGPKGIGKKTLADIFSKAILCESQKHKPCNECKSCTLYNSKAHPDVKIIKEVEKKQIGVETIRELIEDVYIKPYMKKRKIYLVHDAHKMSSASQNALLKVFEEPPLYATIILFANDDKALFPTIRSRAQILRFLPNKKEDVFKFINENYDVSFERANFVCEASDGIIGKAIKLLENEDYFEQRNEFFNIIHKLQYDKFYVYDIATFFENNNLEYLIGFFISFLRDTLLLKILGNDANIVNLDFNENIVSFCENVTLKGILSSLNLVIDTWAKMGVNTKENLWILELLLNCWEELHGESHRRQV